MPDGSNARAQKRQQIRPAKRAVNVSVDAALVADAKAAGLNLSAVLEQALRTELKEKLDQQWREENRAAIEAYNEFIAENGSFGDEWRNF